MASGPFDILLILGMVILGWMLFAAWLVMLVIGGVWRGVTLLAGKARRVAPASVRTRRCERLRCRTVNPMGANYCRRCGSPLTGAVCQPRRAAGARAA